MKEGSFQTCNDLSISLEHLRDLKQVFDTAFEKVVSSGSSQDQQEAQRSKEAFETGMKQLREEVSLSQKSFVETHTDQLISSLLEKKETGDPLNKYELFVLYELHTTSVPLSEDLLAWRKARNHEGDLLTLFDDPSQIARSPEDVTSFTKIYIGPIDIGLFQRLPDSCTHIYESFPERRTLFDMRIGGKDELELQDLLKRSGYKSYSSGRELLKHDDFKRSLREPDPNQSDDWTQRKLKSPEQAKLIRLRVEDLGLSDGATTEQIFERAIALGLELCPPEVGLQFRLQYANQPMNEYVYVGMKQITVSDGSGHVFSVARDDGGSWLYGHWTEPASKWRANHQFVFRLRKPAQL